MRKNVIYINIMKFLNSKSKKYIVLHLFANIKDYGLIKGVKFFLEEKNVKNVNSKLESFRDTLDVVILTSNHTFFVANLIKYHLQQINIFADIIFGMPLMGYKKCIHYVLCPQMFKILPDKYIAFQFEQNTSLKWMIKKYFKILNNALLVFDYSLKNIEYFLNNRILHLQQLYFLPIAYFSNYKDYLGMIKSNVEEYDILFYGDIKNRRRKIFLEVINKKYNVKIINNLFGKELVNEIAKAKIIINIHYYDNALLETTRLYECLSLDKLIVSERSHDQSEYAQLEGIIDFVDVDDSVGMLDRITFWLNNDSKRREKIKHNKLMLNDSINQFKFYFNRYLLSADIISFEKFWQLTAQDIKINSNFLCLSLVESISRRKNFEKSNKFNIEIYNGLRHQKAWVGCGFSFKSIIKKAKENNLDYVVICEDDVKFYSDFEVKFSKIKSYLLSNIDKWDVFSGIIADLREDTQILQIEQYDNFEFIYIDKLISAVFNIYNKSVFDLIINWDDSIRDQYLNTIDRYIENSKNIRVITLLPFLVGHTEEHYSTVWGFTNIKYANLIRASSKLLEKKVFEFKQHSNLN